MLNLPPTVRIWLGVEHVDMRKSFDSLAELVRRHLLADPLSGHLFVFRNRPGDRLKLLYWDEDGYVIVYKRLEAGTFRFPNAAAGIRSIAIRPSDLLMLLDGVDLASVQRRKRFRRAATAQPI